MNDFLSVSFLHLQNDVCEDLKDVDKNVLDRMKLTVFGILIHQIMSVPNENVSHCMTNLVFFTNPNIMNNFQYSWSIRSNFGIRELLRDKEFNFEHHSG